MVLGVFRKRSDEPESIPEGLLESVPEIGGGGSPAAARPILVGVEAEEDPLRGVRESLDRASLGLSQMARRVKDLESENARLAARLREAEGKAAVLDEVRASLDKAR